MGLLAGYTREPKDTAYRLGRIDNRFPLTYKTTTNYRERMRIESKHNIGMGTTSPTAILHIQQS